MKHLMLRIAVIAALFIMATSVYAQTSPKVDVAMKELVKKYEGVDGVTCFTVGKGSGLGVIKMMLNKELGSSFFDGVKKITIIEYSEASEATTNNLHQDLDVFLSLLTEIDFNGSEEVSDNEFTRCFAEADSEKISELVMAFEREDSKMVMYMSGDITLP